MKHIICLYQPLEDSMGPLPFPPIPTPHITNLKIQQEESCSGTPTIISLDILIAVGVDATGVRKCLSSRFGLCEAGVGGLFFSNSLKSSPDPVQTPTEMQASKSLLMAFTIFGLNFYIRRNGERAVKLLKESYRDDRKEQKIDFSTGISSIHLQGLQLCHAYYEAQLLI